jgi:hypothetical protein
VRHTMSVQSTCLHQQSNMSESHTRSLLKAPVTSAGDISASQNKKSVGHSTSPSHLLLSLLPCCLCLLQARVHLHQLISKRIQRLVPVRCALMHRLQQRLALLHSNMYSKHSMLCTAMASMALRSTASALNANHIPSSTFSQPGTLINCSCTYCALSTKQ